MDYFSLNEPKSQADGYSFLDMVKSNYEHDNQQRAPHNNLGEAEEESQNVDILGFNEGHADPLSFCRNENYSNAQNRGAQNSNSFSLLENLNNISNSIAPQQRRREELNFQSSDNYPQKNNNPLPKDNNKQSLPQNNKRSRFEQAIPESREEEDEFYKEAVNIHHSNANYAGKNEHLIVLNKNQPREADRNLIMNLRKKEVKQEKLPPQEQVMVEKQKRTARKVEVVAHDETNEDIVREITACYEELNKKYLERKEKIKMLNKLGDHFKTFYSKVQDLKMRTSLLMERALHNYLETLESYNSLFAFDDSSFDEQIRQNELRKVKIKEKFSFN